MQKWRGNHACLIETQPSYRQKRRSEEVELRCGNELMKTKLYSINHFNGNEMNMISSFSHCAIIIFDTNMMVQFICLYYEADAIAFFFLIFSMNYSRFHFLCHPCMFAADKNSLSSYQNKFQCVVLFCFSLHQI